MCTEEAAAPARRYFLTYEGFGKRNGSHSVVTNLVYGLSSRQDTIAAHRLWFWEPFEVICVRASKT